MKFLLLFPLFVVFLLITPSLTIPSISAQTSAKQQNYLRYCDDEHTSAKIEYPVTWSRDDDVQHNSVTFTSPDGKAHADLKVYNYNVMEQPPHPRTFASEKLASYVKSSHVMVIENGTGTVEIPQITEFAPPPDGYKVEYTYVDTNNTPFHEIELFTNDNLAIYKEYDIGFYTSEPDFANYRDIFNHMIDSFSPMNVCGGS